MPEVTFADRLRLRRAAAGLTQRELAERAGVKQPLIAAIERGTRKPTEAVRQALDAALQVRPSQLLRAAREDVLWRVRQAGGHDVRVFGSVATGRDQADSDIDLLVTFEPGSDIVTLLGLQEELTNLLTVSVDVVSAGSTGPVVERALIEARPL